MPPVRTHTDPLNSASPNVESPYNIPSRTSPVRGITFAPNVAAETYNEPPELIVPPESTLFPSSNVQETPRKPSHSKKKPDDWIPRPPNAFILFRSEMVEQFIKSQHVPGDVEANHGNLSKIIGLCWRNLPFEERDVWECKARIAMAEHKAKYPNYRFRPNQKDPNSVKRRVKEPPAPPDEKRCEEIATLLVEGMKGDELSCAVKALDATRPPEVITPRFDDPVTAATLCRRSSSAPVPEADVEETKFAKPSTPTRPSRASRPRKHRAASSSPIKKRAPRSIITSRRSPAQVPTTTSPAPSFNSESEDGGPLPNADTGPHNDDGISYTPYCHQDAVLDQSGHPLVDPTCSPDDADPFMDPFESGGHYTLPFPQEDPFNPFGPGGVSGHIPSTANGTLPPLDPSYSGEWSPTADGFYIPESPSDSPQHSPSLEHSPVSEFASPYLPAPVPRTCGELSSALTHLEFAAINRGYGGYSELGFALFAPDYNMFSPSPAGDDMQHLHDYRHAVQELHIGGDKALHVRGDTPPAETAHVQPVAY